MFIIQISTVLTYLLTWFIKCTLEIWTPNWSCIWIVKSCPIAQWSVIWSSIQTTIWILDKKKFNIQMFVIQIPSVPMERRGIRFWVAFLDPLGCLCLPLISPLIFLFPGKIPTKPHVYFKCSLYLYYTWLILVYEGSVNNPGIGPDSDPAKVLKANRWRSQPCPGTNLSYWAGCYMPGLRFTKLQNPVVRNGSPIKWSMPLPLMATVKDTTCQGGEIERNYKDDGSSTGWTDWRLLKVNHMRLKTT